MASLEGATSGIVASRVVRAFDKDNSSTLVSPVNKHNASTTKTEVFPLSEAYLLVVNTVSEIR